MNDSEPQKMVVVVRKDLELPTGKWIAQAVHSAVRSCVKQIKLQPKLSALYEHTSSPICIVCSVKTEKQLLNLLKKAREVGVPCGLQRDAGHNFVDVNTPTVLCIGPAPQSQIDPLTKRLQLLA
jgi:peptidyl-tRNA hydrolase, PTH2 family